MLEVRFRSWDCAIHELAETSPLDRAYTMTRASTIELIVVHFAGNPECLEEGYQPITPANRLI